MKRSAISCLATAAALAALSAEKKFAFDCEAWAEGDVPKEVFVVDGTIKIAAKDGGKAILIDPVPITDATAQLGDSANGSASIQAKVFASKKGRSLPRFGVSAHGMSGCRLIVNPPKKTIELQKADQVLASAPFAWATDTWTRLSLTVEKQSDTEWHIAGKAWADGSTEPAEPQIKHTDAALKGQGKCAILGTPLSEMPIFFDDIAIAVAAGE